jgi:hypothetical protein
VSGTTSISPDARRLWRAARVPLALALLILMASIANALVRGPAEGGTLDPRGVVPSGSRVLARLLEAQGVQVELVRTTAAAQEAIDRDGRTSLFVTRPNWLVPEQLRALRDVNHLLLVAPGGEALDAVAPVLQPSGESDVGNRSPNCSLPAAQAAGVADMGGVLYRAKDGGGNVQLCYAEGGQASLATVVGGGRTTTVIGTAAPFTNEKLDEDGNAALTMRLLGQQPRLVWYVPSLGDPSLRGQEQSFYDLVPSGWKFGLVQAAIAVLLLALWRARRLGPVVAEPLPVVVRSAETVEGRARLYRRAGARAHAAAVLRSAARDRLVPLLGLPPDADPHAVVDAVARRSGRPAANVGSVMYGSPPPDDAGLVRLADALDALEKEVGRT